MHIGDGIRKMIIPNQKVTVKWHWLNRNHFEIKGYVFSKYGDAFMVDITDLLPNQIIEVRVTCDYCNKEKACKYNKVSNKKYHYCNASCMFKHKQKIGTLPPSHHDYHCDYCNKIFKVENYRYDRLKNGEYNNLFCSKKCQSLWIGENATSGRKISNIKYEKICPNCKKVFTVNESRKNTAKYCSAQCRVQGNMTSKIVKCDNCGNETKKTKSILENNKNAFCSPSCVNEFKIKMGNEERICEICNNNYITRKSSNQRFCSISCQSKWQSEFLVGENANNYKKDIPFAERFVNCKWCKVKFQLSSPYKVKNVSDNNAEYFCSIECKQEWYAKVWSQSKQWKEESRKRTVKMLSEGKVNKVNSGCQVLVNKILNEINIDYINEYDCNVVSIDNYISAQNLMIEVMGTFWHTDPRFYKEINYQQQYDRIINDKRKQSIILNNYGIKILYLWEYDIENSPRLCEELIKLYINSKGILKDYQSFNYSLVNGTLTLNEEIIEPYFYKDIEILHDYFRIKYGEKRSNKQLDKWITFNCEHCNKETEQLKSRYEKRKNHFCSYKCKSIYQKGKSRKNHPL